jgi:Growth inhibitor
MERNILRGDMYYADLSPVIGSEQGGNRPVLIIQNDIGNRHSPTVIVAAITGKAGQKAKLPTHCYLHAENGLDMPSIVLLEQIRTVDKKRLNDFIGRLEGDKISRINNALAISVGLAAKGGV